MASNLFKGLAHAAVYKKFRPIPPPSLVSFIKEYLKKELPTLNNGKWALAIDAGCGSGQSTNILADYFDSVIGCDVSEAQIKEANINARAANVSYQVSTADKLPFASESVQLVQASTAAHWFDMPKFYAEVDRILVKGGVVAIYCHSVIQVVDHPKAEAASALISDFFMKKMADYWESGRRHVDNGYSDPSFISPYPKFLRDESHYRQREVSAKDIQGHLSTLSSYREYCKRHGEEAGSRIMHKFLERLMVELEASGSPEETLVQLKYPYFLIMARKPLS